MAMEMSMENANDVLERLMIKKDPRTFQNFEIDIPEPQVIKDIVLETPIVDKQTDDFSRIDFLNTFNKNPVPTIVEEPVMNETELQESEKGLKDPLVEDPLVKDPLVEDPLVKDPLVETKSVQGDTPITQKPIVPPEFRIIRKLNMKITLLPSEAIAKPTPSKRLTKKPESATKPESVVKAFPEASVKIGDINIDQRIDMANKNQDTGIKADAYYLANREIHWIHYTHLF